MEYAWPGNVRELENFIERAVVTAKGKILTPHDFPKELAFGMIKLPASEINVGTTIYEAEKGLILKTLKAYAGNRTKTAEILRISTRTLRNKLNEYGLKDGANDQD